MVVVLFANWQVKSILIIGRYFTSQLDYLSPSVGRAKVGYPGLNRSRCQVVAMGVDRGEIIDRNGVG